MMFTLRTILMASVGSLFFASSMPADAITLTFGGTQTLGLGQFSSVSGATTIDFELGAPTSGFAVYSAPGTGPTVVSGSLPGVYAAPLADNTHYLTVAPFGDRQGTNPVLIQFATLLDYFGLYWGSANPYNAISFYKGGTLIKSFTGSEIPLSGVYVNFFAAPNEAFDTVALSSTSAAFETDNHAYRIASSEAVPEPTTIAGIVFAGSGLFAAHRRKYRQNNLVVKKS